MRQQFQQSPDVMAKFTFVYGPRSGAVASGIGVRIVSRQDVRAESQPFLDYLWPDRKIPALGNRLIKGHRLSAKMKAGGEQ
jgi:hypothetical protein